MAPNPTVRLIAAFSGEVRFCPLKRCDAVQRIDFRHTGFAAEPLRPDTRLWEPVEDLILVALQCLIQVVIDFQRRHLLMLRRTLQGIVEAAHQPTECQSNPSGIVEFLD
mmetsp:Transcript_16249/g.38380  ORF Transcript_16249/g.38380 Transcript_16249/m.38380 type:complete len:109 (+) Transcript_16249:634-960(+)